MKTKKKRKPTQPEAKKQKPSNEIIWKMIPAESTTGTCKTTKWVTECGRYKVARIVSIFEPESPPSFVAVRVFHKEGMKPSEVLLETEREEGGKSKGYYAKKYRNLDGALQSVENYHISKFGEVAKSNRMELVLHADKEGLSGGKAIATPKECVKADKPKVERSISSGDKQSPSTERKKVGVISAIVECLEKASAKKPITMDEILDVLCDKFPERDRKGMKSTVYLQLTSKHKLQAKGYKINKNDKGYWL